MHVDNEEVYPNRLVTTRTVEIGGLTKAQLIQKLKQSDIRMNEYAERLLTDDRFTTSDTRYSLQTVEVTVGDLGFRDGATTDQIYQRAAEFGLALCPLELGPYIRLQYADQPEGDSGDGVQRNQAPSGSITIASRRLTDDDDFPKGFYLRRMNDALWLRGYRADHLHVWNPYDHFIFVKPEPRP